MTDSLKRYCSEKLAVLDERRQRRSLVDTARLRAVRTGGMRVERGGRVLVDFSSNDALDLAGHPRVVEAAAEAARAYGAGATASRLVSGNHPLFSRLEARLAAHKETEAALVVGSGFLANAGVVPALVAEPDLVVVDALAHASLMTGVRLARSSVVVAPHNDVAAVAAALAAYRREQGPSGRCLVVTESVFSMDGDRAPLPQLAEVCRAHDAWLLVDDAHGFLVSPDEPPVSRFADVVTGTLSKATGSYGGTIAGPAALIELLLSRARTLVYSTGLPPSAVAAVLAALDVVDDEPERMARPRALAARFCDAVGLPSPASHIVPLTVGAEGAALELMAGLVEDGFLAVAIRPPTVPSGTSRLRLSFSAGHSEEDVDGLAAHVRRRLRGRAREAGCVKST